MLFLQWTIGVSGRQPFYDGMGKLEGKKMVNHTSSNLKSSRIRPDGIEKVTGNLSYLTDLHFPEMLYGKVLRSKYPHEKILSISVESEDIPGVKAVIMSKDVPGSMGLA